MTASWPHVALMASPLLGPTVWRPAASALAARGWDVRVLPAPAQAPHGPDQVREHLLDVLPAGQPLALVAHSNAGLYVPTVTVDRDVVASVFVDAALPPAAGSAPLAPPAMLGTLEDLADCDGLLPPWTQWWTEQDLAPLFPDPATRAAVEADQHRLPLAYFTAAMTVPSGWTARPAAYLAFGDTYRAEREQAAAWGWPVRTLVGGHLYLLVDPSAVATIVDELLRSQLGPADT